MRAEIGGGSASSRLLDVPGSMRAVVQHAYGSADVLRSSCIYRPTFGDHEVLVRVHAAGVDRGAWHVMTGRPHALRLAFGVRRPRNPVPGGELAGTVVGVGGKVTAFAVGDEVFGFGRGTFAEYAVARESRLAHKPGSLSFVEAASVPISGATALQAVDLGGVRPGDHVLVTGASGGVGSHAVQLAKALGAEVTAVAGPAKQGLLRELGADHVVDYTVTGFSDLAGDYDVVLDIAGNPTVAQLLGALTPTGTAVIVGGEEGGSWTGGMDRQMRGRIVSLFTRRRVTNFVAKQRAADLARLAELVEAGAVLPRVHETYSLERAADAMRALEAGRVRGKLVVVVQE